MAATASAATGTLSESVAVTTTSPGASAAATRAARAPPALPPPRATRAAAADSGAARAVTVAVLSTRPPSTSAWATVCVPVRVQRSCSPDGSCAAAVVHGRASMPSTGSLMSSSRRVPAPTLSTVNVYVTTSPSARGASPPVWALSSAIAGRGVSGVVVPASALTRVSPGPVPVTVAVLTTRRALTSSRVMTYAAGAAQVSVAPGATASLPPSRAPRRPAPAARR